jgi:hypothetical protein
VTIARCIDGDGEVIAGRECPCHPDIADGYSVAYDVELVSAIVLGVLEL